MWNARQQPLPSDRGIKFIFDEEGEQLSFKQVLYRWSTKPDFCRFFNDSLARVPYVAFRWETPRLTQRDRPFECVVLDSPELDRPPDAQAFVEHFAAYRTTDPVIRFANLGGDAEMIVPKPIDSHQSYVHLARFMRFAPEAQRLALWQLVGTTMLNLLGPQPLWLSTAGGGVAWLHVRIDHRPKYYGHAAYRQET